MESNYRKIRDFIRRISVKNTDGTINNLLGINIDKYFMPSVANVIGTDLTKYKVVKPNQFSCNRMHVGRDKRLPVSLSKEDFDFIVSPAYDVFEIISPEELDSDYLMLWFSRKEFDRNAWFYTDSDVRGKLGWDSLCEMKIPVPSIEKQREIVKEYNTVVTRIQLNEQLNKKLEETAQALYKHWFVDFEFPNEVGMPYKSSGGKLVYNTELDKDIPEGWEVVSVDDEFNIQIGRTPPRQELEWFTANNRGIKWVSIKDLGENGSYILKTSEELTKEAITKFNVPIIPKGVVVLSFKMSVGKVGITDEEMLSNEAIAHFVQKEISFISNVFIYFYLKSYNYNSLGTTSSIVNSINSTMVKELVILKPMKKNIDNFNHKVNFFFDKKLILEKQNIKLTELRNLFLSKMTMVEVEKEMA